MGLRGPPRTQALVPRVATGSTRPVRRSSSCGHSTRAPSLRRSGGRPSMDFRSPTELDHRDPAPSRRFPGKPDDTSSPGLSLPYDTVSNRRSRLPAANPFATAYHVRGLVTPFAISTTGPPGTTSAPEHPWASPFKGFPSPRSVLLSEPVPSCRYLARPASPEESESEPACFRALFPRRVRSDTGTTRVPAVDPFLGFDPPELAPVRPGARFGRGTSPLALGRLDVQARLGLRVSGCERVG